MSDSTVHGDDITFILNREHAISNGDRCEVLLRV